MNIFKKIFGKKTEASGSVEHVSQELVEKAYDDKQRGLESVLGQMKDIVGHAIIPFAVGGAVDMYYFPNHILGTGFATMELLDASGKGSQPNELGTYEFVAFTKLPYDSSERRSTSFDLIERRICAIFTTIGNYSFQAVLKPGDTCEVPRDDEDNWCVVFDLYQPEGKEFSIGERKHHLLLCMEIFRSEMEYAIAHGSNSLFEKLKEGGHYPYSDLNREAVV